MVIGGKLFVMTTNEMIKLCVRDTYENLFFIEEKQKIHQIENGDKLIIYDFDLNKKLWDGIINKTATDSDIEWIQQGFPENNWLNFFFSGYPCILVTKPSEVDVKK